MFIPAPQKSRGVGRQSCNHASTTALSAYEKLMVIAAFALVAVVMVSVWIGSRDLKVADAPDRNVPGATTGKGKSSLAVP
jgi:hypothetical protein